MFRIDQVRVPSHNIAILELQLLTRRVQRVRDADIRQSRTCLGQLDVKMTKADLRTVSPQRLQILRTLCRWTCSKNARSSGSSRCQKPKLSSYAAAILSSSSSWQRKAPVRQFHLAMMAASTGLIRVGM
jgi:hypothetical protein